MYRVLEKQLVALDSNGLSRKPRQIGPIGPNARSILAPLTMEQIQSQKFGECKPMSTVGWRVMRVDPMWILQGAGLSIEDMLEWKWRHLKILEMENALSVAFEKHLRALRDEEEGAEAGRNDPRYWSWWMGPCSCPLHERNLDPPDEWYSAYDMSGADSCGTSPSFKSKEQRERRCNARRLHRPEKLGTLKEMCSRRPGHRR